MGDNIEDNGGSENMDRSIITIDLKEEDLDINSNYLRIEIKEI